MDSRRDSIRGVEDNFSLDIAADEFDNVFCAHSKLEMLTVVPSYRA